jgi:hypothetical protein
VVVEAGVVVVVTGGAVVVVVELVLVVETVGAVVEVDELVVVLVEAPGQVQSDSQARKPPPGEPDGHCVMLPGGSHCSVPSRMLFPHS